MGITEVTVPKQYVLVQTTEPTGAFEGQLWYDSSEDLTYIFQDDDWQLITLDISQEVLDLATENAQQQIDIIELQANASVTPFDHNTLLSDTFSDADGYKDSVNTGNTDADFKTNKYQRNNTTDNDLTTDLKSYYKLDEESGTNVADATETTNGTSASMTINEAGKLGKCYRLSSNSSTIDLGAYTQGALTWNVWVKYGNSLNNTNQLLAVRNATRIIYLNYRNWGDSTGITKPGFSVGGEIAELSADLEEDTDTWYMLTGTWDGTTNANGVKFYLNGTLEAQATAGTAGGTTQNLTLGHASWIGNSNSNISFDEVGIWNRVLTADEIALLYNEGNALAYEDFEQPLPAQETKTVEIDLPTITGTVTHTELVINGTIETGASITYKLNNGTTDDTEETPNTKNAYNLTGVPTKLKILLNPKETDPTSGNPGITSYCLKLWKA